MKQEILQDRFAVMNNLWQKYSLFYALRSIRAAGFSKVDLWAGEPHLFIPDCSYAGLKTVRRFAASLGLTFSCLTPEMNGYPLSAAISDMGMRERAFQYGKKCIDAAEALEAGHVLFAPGWRYETDDRRESIHRTAEFLLEMADYAEHKGVLIETQHLTPFSSNLVNTIDDLQELADFLDDRIGFVADTSILCGQGEKIEDYLNYVQGICDRSAFQSEDVVNAEDKIILISTCSYDVKDGRFVMIGKLVPVNGAN